MLPCYEKASPSAPTLTRCFKVCLSTLHFPVKRAMHFVHAIRSEGVLHECQ